ncbi:hypothetical protein V3C99_018036, partial [Haemonchus contortus]
ETCIALKDHNNQPVGIISMKIDGILFQCRKNVEFFTRDHQLTSESVHRCYLAGTCDRRTCENMSPIEKSKEFSSTANNNPGYTFCLPSCGCLSYGCFLCEPSCLFYRVYAIPVTSTVYTIFTCPSWEIIVTVEVTIRQKDSTTSTTIQLHPGQTTAWNDLRFSLVGTIVPQLPILSSTFAQTDYSTSVIKKPAHRGQLQPHSAGQLQCSTKEHAQIFNCTFAVNACKCTHGLYKASCTCSSGSVADLMQPSPLPLISKNVIIFAENQEVYAKTSIGSALQLQFVAENMKITTRQSNATCTIETSDLNGCYNCLAGAELKFYCRSSESEVTANIDCPSQTQVAVCTPSGHINNLRFHLDTSTVSMTCTASCPGGTIPFTVKGSLLYVDDNLIKSDLQSEANIRDAPRYTTFLGHLFGKVEKFVSEFRACFQLASS